MFINSNNCIDLVSHLNGSASKRGSAPVAQDFSRLLTQQKPIGSNSAEQKPEIRSQFSWFLLRPKGEKFHALPLVFLLCELHCLFSLSHHLSSVHVYPQTQKSPFNRNSNLHLVRDQLPFQLRSQMGTLGLPHPLFGGFVKDRKTFCVQVSLKEAIQSGIKVIARSL